MTLNASAVRVAGTGEIFFAPVGTALPTDTTTALPAAWVGCGYVTTDGIEFSYSRDTTEIDAWQGDSIRILTTKTSLSFKASLMEFNGAHLKTAFGGGTVAAGQFAIPAAGVNQEQSCVIVWSDGTINYRFVMGRVQQQGELSFTLNREGALELPLDMAVLEPASGSLKFSIITDDTNF